MVAAIKIILPDVPDYTEDAYTVLYYWPAKRLADYGVFVKILIVPILNKGYDTIDAIEPIVALYKIDH